MNLTACNLAQKLDSLQDIEGGKFEVVYASAESATRISNDNFNRGSFRRIQIVNIVFRQHIAVYRSKKFVVFSAVGKLQRFLPLTLDASITLWSLFVSGELSSHAFAI